LRTCGAPVAAGLVPATLGGKAGEHDDRDSDAINARVASLVLDDPLHEAQLSVEEGFEVGDRPIEQT
jgi:hypothetical protein